MAGLAPDGGLFLPETLPCVADRLDDWRGLSYADLAFAIMQPFADVPGPDLRGMIDRSYSRFRVPDVAPVTRLGDVFLLELFHGPTLAFKDIALQFLGNLFEHVLAGSGRRLNVVVATSGDTGSAAICGVRGRRHIRIFVMHPHGCVSPVQERQMTSVLDDNVFNLAVDGTFDDCQRILKAVFNDLAFKQRCALGAVNSINWARLLAQVVYYFYAALRVMDETGAQRVRFAVPTGNFGDILAGYLAARMGLPVGRLVLATNENDILARFFRSGDYSLRNVRKTISPSMDIQVASNFERYLYYRLERSGQRVRELMSSFARDGRLHMEADGGDQLFEAGSGDTAATLDTIRRCHDRHDRLLDPHSAVGVCVGEQFLDPAEPMICLATAHPAKFPEAIRRATGKDIARHPLIDALEGLPVRSDVIPASTGALREYLLRHIPEA